eukprot:3879218-Karenia_brevis.AAC.2
MIGTRMGEADNPGPPCLDDGGGPSWHDLDDPDGFPGLDHIHEDADDYVGFEPVDAASNSAIGRAAV